MFTNNYDNMSILLHFCELFQYERPLKKLVLQTRINIISEPHSLAK
jgi:hypothetical protein